MSLLPLPLNIHHNQQGVYLLDDLYAFYKLDEASGNALDAHGSLNLTDNNTVQSVTGVVNGARFFSDANNERFNSSTFDISGTGDRSFAFWIKYDTTLGVTSVIGHFGTGTNYEWQILCNGSTLILYVSPDGSSNPASSFAGLVDNDTWTHVTFVYRPSTSVTAFKNGSYYGVDVSGIASTIFDGGLDFEMGRNGSKDFSLDEVGFWKRALNPREIKALYDQTEYSSFVSS